MAVIYLRSTDGNDADNGSTWALAKATLAAAITAAGAGGTIYVADGHSENIGASTIWTIGTVTAPVKILCVDDTGDPEPPTTLATGAALVATGNYQLNLNGYGYIYGITFDASAGSNVADILFGSATANGSALVLERCVFKPGNHSAADIQIGTSASVNVDDCVVEWINCSIHMTNSASGLQLASAKFIWRDTPSNGIASGSAVPANLLENVLNGTGPVAIIRGVDLSAMGSGDTLVVASGTPKHEITFENCKLGASVALTSGAIVAPGAAKIRFINCDSGPTNYRYYKQDFSGTITQETTIVRSSGATDGTTPISRKMVTTADANFIYPLVSDDIVFWNETTGGGVTVTIPVLTDNVTLTDAEAWIEVEYLGTSGFPLASMLSDRAADILEAGVAQDTDATSSWTTTGLGTPVKQELSVTVTPQEKGPIRVRVYLARASTTMYFDPLAITGARQFQVGDTYQNQPAAGGGGGQTSHCFIG